MQGELLARLQLSPRFEAQKKENIPECRAAAVDPEIRTSFAGVKELCLAGLLGNGTGVGVNVEPDLKSAGVIRI